MTSEDEHLPGPKPVSPLNGDERFLGIDATVRDFWSWSTSGLIDNSTRGILAEFLVAKAVGCTQEVRVNWDNYDILSASGVRIEVKSSGLLQAWKQKRLSTPQFGRLTGREWDSDTLEWSGDRLVRADVFVFAIHLCEEHALYDALDTGQWEFWVVPAAAVQAAGSRSVGLGWVKQHGTGPHELSGLSAAVDEASSTH